MAKYNLWPALWAFLTVFSFTACIQTEQTYRFAAPGIWRGVLILEKPVFPSTKKDDISIVYDQFKPGELPFNFEVVYTSPDRFYVEFINGSERIRCDSIRLGRDRTTARDTMNIYFPEYQSYIHAEVRGGAMQGYWKVSTKKDHKIPFVADAGRTYRFTNMQTPPTMDLSGEWATLFGTETDRQEKAIGEFVQKGNHITGTFRTETGDYRFLEGTVQGRKFWLSAFDGSHAVLVTGNTQGDSLQGDVRFGNNPPTLWTAWKDPGFRLGHPDSLTALTGAALKFDFTTPDGRNLRFPGPEFDGKVGIVTIMGTWCPNCRDEQVFLKQFLKEHPDLAERIKIVGVSFERHDTPEKANTQLIQYQKALGIPFDLVYGGKADKTAAAAAFPALEKVVAFPTMMILNKQGKLVKVHTGFDGPATSKYADFKEKFTALITQLVQA